MLLLMREEGPVGRYSISRELGLPDGVARGVLSRLKRLGFFNVSKKGCTVTEIGANLLSDALQSLKIKSVKLVDFDFLAIDRFCAVAHVSQERQGLSGATLLRDKAVRAGASGAIILVYEKGKLVIPSVYNDLSAINPFLDERLRKEFPLMDDDLLVSVFAPYAWKAKEAAISTIL